MDRESLSQSSRKISHVGPGVRSNTICVARQSAPRVEERTSALRTADERPCRDVAEIQGRKSPIRTAIESRCWLKNGQRLQTASVSHFTGQGPAGGFRASKPVAEIASPAYNGPKQTTDRSALDARFGAHSGRRLQSTRISRHSSPADILACWHARVRCCGRAHGLSRGSLSRCN
jgi:hypothetical protein